MSVRGRSHTKPGSLLKDAIPIRTWAAWNDAAPGFAEIDLVGHEGGNAVGEHAHTLTVTDIATGWTENRSVGNKAQKWVVAALEDIEQVMPFPLLGIDSDNGSEFINYHLLRWCTERQLTFTRSRPGNYRPSPQARPQPGTNPQFKPSRRAHPQMSQRLGLRAHLDMSHRGGTLHRSSVRPAPSTTDRPARSCR